MPVPPFDDTGFLPPGRHAATREEFRVIFVDAFPDSTTREPIHDGWSRHRDAIHSITPVEQQWIGGSYVTAKTDPNDMDVCTFIDGPTFDALPARQQMVGATLLNTVLRSPGSKQHWKCDSYILVGYPVGHPARAEYEAAMTYWANHWGHTRPDASGAQAQRGYVVV